MEYLNNNYDKIFNYFNKIFEEVFNDAKLSNQTLSESDIKSLFRTLDNFYDILIKDNSVTYEQNYYKNIISILDNICKYLSYITYPSETIRLVGKRITLISFHLGDHQDNISFPFIDNMDNITLNNFLNYSYDNFYLNEKICSIKNSTSFCLTKDNFDKLKKELISKKYDLNNILLSIYLLQDITKENEQEKSDDEGHSEWGDIIEYNTLFKKYSFIFKLFNKTNNEITLLDNNNITFDAEFQYKRELNYSDKKNYMDSSDIKEFNKSINLNISLYPNNSNISCVPKNYKDLNENYLCKTHFNYDENKIRCNCNIIDEIIIIEDFTISQFYKSKQFPQRQYNLLNIYSFPIILFFILLLLIPSIYILLKDIINDSKYIKNNQDLAKELEDELKVNYMKVKKYNNIGTFRFSIYLALKKFPYFTIFNKYKLNYPKYISHLVIYVGILIGFIIPLIPFYYKEFIERQIFIDQRDIKYDDNYITDMGPSIYYDYSFYYGFIGLFLSHFFIYIFNIVLGYYQEEINIWLKIKTICKDYVYYEIKSEILLGTTWSKIKLRIISFYYICGNYILKKFKKNQKFEEYLNYISRNIKDRNTINNIGAILPRTSINSYISNDINLDNKKNTKSLEMTEKTQLLLEKDNNSINDNNNKRRMLTIKYHNKNKINFNSKICKTDNFILDNAIKNDKSKRSIERFEKIRNKYIYKLKKNIIKEMEIDKEIIDLNEEKKDLYISPQINYSIYQAESFYSLKKTGKEKESKHIINKYVLISVLLWIIFIVLIILAIFLIQNHLNKFDRFIIGAWLIPIIIIIIVINFILYYIKILIGSILLFHRYNVRKKKCFYRFLFWLFVDKTMIHIFKVRNLITKYKKEFDYLIN
jgi:hypothetical protein